MVPYHRDLKLQIAIRIPTAWFGDQRNARDAYIAVGLAFALLLPAALSAMVATRSSTLGGTTPRRLATATR